MLLGLLLTLSIPAAGHSGRRCRRDCLLARDDRPDSLARNLNIASQCEQGRAALGGHLGGGSIAAGTALT
jgi:hypothetical protein